VTVGSLLLRLRLKTNSSISIAGSTAVFRNEWRCASSLLRNAVQKLCHLMGRRS
jgi:hypothetical protein